MENYHFKVLFELDNIFVSFIASSKNWSSFRLISGILEILNDQGVIGQHQCVLYCKP